MKLKCCILFSIFCFSGFITTAQLLSLSKLETLAKKGAIFAMENIPIGFEFIGISKTESIYAFSAKQYNSEKKKYIEYIQFYTEKNALHYLLLSKASFLNFKNQILKSNYKKTGEHNTDLGAIYIYTSTTFQILLPEKADNDYFKLVIFEKTKYNF